MHDEALRPGDRLRRRPEYLECYRRGRRRSTPEFLLYFRPNELGHPRLGITASRKVGPAVVRNRLRRRVREIFRRSPTRDRIGSFDVVVHLQSGAAALSFGDLRDRLERQWTGLTPRAQQPAGGRGA